MKQMSSISICMYWTYQAKMISLCSSITGKGAAVFQPDWRSLPCCRVSPVLPSTSFYVGNPFILPTIKKLILLRILSKIRCESWFFFNHLRDNIIITRVTYLEIYSIYKDWYMIIGMSTHSELQYSVDISIWRVDFWLIF